MIINVGSEDVVKVDAVSEILKDYKMFDGFDIKGVVVASGVQEQLKSGSDVRLCATNRAENAFQKSRCNYSFGIENGIDFDKNVGSKWVDYCVCAMYGGKEFYYGESRGLEIPESIIELSFKERCNINTAYKKLGIGNKEHRDDEEYTKQAIQMALTKLENSGF